MVLQSGIEGALVYVKHFDSINIKNVINMFELFYFYYILYYII